ncbi:MAG: GGDEF domain-containing protein [Clostridiaceae bacterium]
MVHKLFEFAKDIFAIPVSGNNGTEFEIEMNSINVSRGKITAMLFIMLEIMQLIFTFLIKGNDFFAKPFIYYSAMYVFLLLAMIAFYIIFIWVETDIPGNSGIIRVVAVLFVSIILLWCAGISLLDQLSSGQFIVYTVAVICVAVTPFYKPVTLLMIYSFIHIIFLALMPRFQSSQEILFGNYLNSTTFVIICLGISYMRYKKLIQDLDNRRIIREQSDNLRKINNELEAVNKKLEELSQIDSLTGIYNRSIFDKTMKAEWERCKRQFAPLSLIMIDIDYFKAFNDNYGHLAGDECLKQIASLLRNLAKRSSDTVTRFGGEEFAIILPYLNKEDAQIIAKQMKDKVEELAIPHLFSSVSDHLTISIGVNSAVPSSDIYLSEFIKTADCALYGAKVERNSIVVA